MAVVGDRQLADPSLSSALAEAPDFRPPLRLSALTQLARAGRERARGCPVAPRPVAGSARLRRRIESGEPGAAARPSPSTISRQSARRRHAVARARSRRTALLRRAVRRLPRAGRRCRCTQPRIRGAPPVMSARRAVGAARAATALDACRRGPTALGDAPGGVGRSSKVDLARRRSRRSLELVALAEPDASRGSRRSRTRRATRRSPRAAERATHADGQLAARSGRDHERGQRHHRRRTSAPSVCCTSREDDSAGPPPRDRVEQPALHVLPRRRR